MIKKILSIFILALSFYSTYATHLVGGEITYTYVSGNTYNINLTVYRDDYFGGAPFDDPATIHLYSEAGVYIQSYDFFLSNPTTAFDYLDNPYPNPCLEIPTDAFGNPQILIQKGIYNDDITVPNANFGYYIMYGRCCRNGGLINNLTNPGDQGSTYPVFIPPTNTFANNSPTYDTPPPIFVCQNSPLSFDQSATDIDGDSLFYSLCAPYQGLTDFNPAIPSGAAPPAGFGPPFTPVVWLPPYSENDPLGGLPLNINPTNGFLTGTPNTIGSFVVGICVEEWRSGVKLSTVLRDFQYTVTSCDNIPIPDVPTTPEEELGIIINLPPGVNGIYGLNCESQTIDFENQSLLPGGVLGTDSNADYWWDFGDGNTSTEFEPTHTYADTGTYIIQISATFDDNGLSCSDTNRYLLFIYPVFAPDFTVDNVCNNDSADFIDITTSAIYDNVVEWNWTFGDGSALSTEQNPSHLYNAPGDYEVILYARSSKGCTRLDTNTVTIYPKPNANFVNPGPGCAGDTLDFTSTSNISSGTLDFAFWDLNNGITNNNFTTNNDYPLAGIYPIQLVVTSDLGCIDSITQLLTINALPIVTTSGNDTICPFTSIQVNAGGGTNYLWSPSDVLDNANIFNPTITPIIGNYYIVEVTDANSCVNTDSLYIGLKDLPPANAGEDTSVCLNVADVTVFNQSVPLLASGGISYSWAPPTALSATNIPNPIASPIVNTSYTVTVADIHGCENYDTIEVVVLNPALDLIAVTTDSLCFGDTVVVDVEDQGAITSYVWSPNTFVTDPLANEPGFYPLVNTLYTLTIQNYCYEDEDSVLIEVVPLPNINAGPLDSICLGDEPYMLNANPTDLEIYNWSSLDPSISNPNIYNPTVEPIVNSSYYLNVVDSVGTLACANNDSVTILVYNNPTLDINFPIDYTGFICQGDSVLLDAISNDAIVFQWDVDPSLSSINNQTTYAFPSDTTEYFVTVENIHACSNRDSIIINVQSPVTATFIGDSIMCYGFYVDLEASGGLYYNWYPEEGNFSNENYNITQAHPDSSLQIFIDVSNDCFNDTIYKNITVYSLPFVDAGEDFTIIRDDVSGFLNGDGDGKPLWYTNNYNFYGILNSPAQYGPEVQPIVSTNYILEIENPITGCRSYDTMRVNVEVLTLLAFPTAFSPNNDGTNDLARILKYLNIKKLQQFSIFNRYGEEIFRTEDISASWDGTYKGSQQEIGVYTWMIRAITKDDDEILKKGNITLIR